MRTTVIVSLLALSLLAGACTPYAVATTARPLAKGERSKASIFSLVRGGLEYSSDSSSSGSVAVPMFDMERRFGLDERSDFGARITSFSGVVMTYKRRLDGVSDKPGAGTALMIGGGVVNWLEHAHLEATLIRSGDEARSAVPYGGLRAIQVIPISSTAVSDTPTLGGFGGLRMGARDGGVSLELGVFYDRSALKMRRGDVVVVPSVTFHGGALGRLLPGGNSRRR